MSAPVRVVFRKFKGGDVIAMFCETAAFSQPGRVLSYMHTGQHAEASRDLGRSLKLATPEEYGPLLRELTSIYGVPVLAVSRLVA